jgi:Spy/CpxP family protein refolding chaperone
MKTIAPTLSRTLLALGAIVVLAAVPAQAQRRGIPPAGRGAVSPAEIQRMFDAFALLQAQEQLKISDDQYTPFLSRFKALQDARRKAMQERLRTIQEVRQLLMETQPDESQLKDRLKTLQDIDSRSALEIRKAYDAIDQVLDIRQQAAFRVFEEAMERRKVELLTRARQANRPRDQ